jgi:hypothetical protein
MFRGGRSSQIAIEKSADGCRAALSTSEFHSFAKADELDSWALGAFDCTTVTLDRIWPQAV